MKQIQPMQLTSEPLIATQLLIQSVNDDLATSCRFEWKLFTEDGTYVNNGTIDCVGEDYTNWQGDNNYPYVFVANFLNLTIID